VRVRAKLRRVERGSGRHLNPGLHHVRLVPGSSGWHKRFATNCGFLNRAGARFCARCGNELPDDDSRAGVSAREPEEQSRPQPTSTPPVRPGRRPRGTILVALVAVLLIGVLYAAYSAMASRTYSDAADAHKLFDCSRAADKYGRRVLLARPAFAPRDGRRS
jgi:hypothetical protein